MSIRIVSCTFGSLGFKPRRTTALANSSGVSSGLSERSISRSLIARTRFQSVSDLIDVDVLFIRGRLSHGNDTDGVCIFCMHDDHNDASERTYADIALFAVFLAVIQECDGVALKTPGASRNSKPCFRRLLRRLLSSQRNCIQTHSSYILQLAQGPYVGSWETLHISVLRRDVGASRALERPV